MLKSDLINPEIMQILSLCGNGSKILIADGNYPLAEKTGNAKKIYLGLSRNIPTVTDVLKILHTAVEIEGAEVMDPADGSSPDIFHEFEKELPGIELEKKGRYDFYDDCMKEENIILAISTGEQRVFANILITIGCA